MNKTQRTYFYVSYVETISFAELLGFKSIDKAEQDLADLHGVKDFHCVPEHYQGEFEDEFESQALDFIRSKGYLVVHI